MDNDEQRLSKQCVGGGSEESKNWMEGKKKHHKKQLVHKKNIYFQLCFKVTMYTLHNYFKVTMYIYIIISK